MPEFREIDYGPNIKFIFKFDGDIKDIDEFVRVHNDPEDYTKNGYEWRVFSTWRGYDNRQVPIGDNNYLFMVAPTNEKQLTTTILGGLEFIVDHKWFGEWKKELKKVLGESNIKIVENTFPVHTNSKFCDICKHGDFKDINCNFYSYHCKDCKIRKYINCFQQKKRLKF